MSTILQKYFFSSELESPTARVKQQIEVRAIRTNEHVLSDNTQRSPFIHPKGMQQNELTESTRSVLEYLSFEAGTSEMTIPSTPDRRGSSNGANGSTRPKHMQGILWKRRDIFKNRWRPRWFVLHEDQRLLTYYLLANQESERVVSGGSASTPGRRRSAAAIATPSSSSISVGSEMNSSIHNTNDNQDDSNRRRTLSESSANTIDCDVVPRGTIYLLGSTVEANEALTIPEEDLYTLTITDHENGNHCHLAARTIEARDQWIRKIRNICQSESGALSQRSITNNRVLHSPQTPMRNSRTEIRRMTSKNKIQPSSSHQNGGHLDDSAEKALPSERNCARDIEVLVVLAPVVLYKALTMTSVFGLATFGFVVGSILSLRWIVIQQFLKVARPLKQEANETSIGRGSICCRVSEDLVDICGSGGAVSLPPILVWSLAKGIRQQPRLVCKKYSMLPPLYSTDITVLDMNEKSADMIWVNKADDMNLDETADRFKATKEKQHSPVGFLQQFIGPACQIVMTSGDSQEVQLELNLLTSPITVFVSCTSEAANISINFQSTDVAACRKFAEEFRKSIRSAKV